MKKASILLVILVLTGCSVDYNLKIDNDAIFEEITGEISKDEFDMSGQENADLYIYELLYLDQSPVTNSEEHYNKTLDDSGDTIKFNYNYKYNNNFKDSHIINNCYENVIFEETNEVYVINLSGNFYCMLADKIPVKITTDYHVISSNAKEVKGNTYTWNLTPDSTDIELVISKTKKPVPNEESTNYFRLIGLIVLVILAIVGSFIYIKYRRRNNEK